MKNATPFPMKSRLLFGISLVLFFAGIYFGVTRKSTVEEGLNSTNPRTVALSEDASISFVSQGNESSPSDTDLVATYSQLYGKYHVKVYANHKFSMPTNLEIEAFRMEANALDQLYFKMNAEERKKIKRVSFPYAKLEVAGKVIYKKFEDLTQKERESLGC
jgi:muramidase (phage lysozyme)